MARRHYSSTSQPVTLTAGITNSNTSLPVSSTAGYPTEPFTIAIERSTANEEACLVTDVPDANHFTVTRGYAGTTAVAHDTGKPVEHAVTSQDYDEATRLGRRRAAENGQGPQAPSPFGGAAPEPRIDDTLIPSGSPGPVSGHSAPLPGSMCS